MHVGLSLIEAQEVSIFVVLSPGPHLRVFEASWLFQCSI